MNHRIFLSILFEAVKCSFVFSEFTILKIEFC